MNLTAQEIDFLAAYAYEATNEPFFSGPASAAMKEKGIGYDDITGLLSCYAREHPGTAECLFGRHDSNPPDCPWDSREEARRRNDEIRRFMIDASEPVGMH